MSDNTKIVIRYGYSPDEELDVVAYGEEAFSEAVRRDVVEERPSWDGTTTERMAVGGQYAVLTDDATKDDLEAIQERHDDAEEQVAALNENGELIEMDIFEL